MLNPNTIVALLIRFRLKNVVVCHSTGLLHSSCDNNFYFYSILNKNRLIIIKYYFWKWCNWKNKISEEKSGWNINHKSTNNKIWGRFGNCVSRITPRWAGCVMNTWWFDIIETAAFALHKWKKAITAERCVESSGGEAIEIWPEEVRREELRYRLCYICRRFSDSLIGFLP